MKMKDKKKKKVVVNKMKENVGMIPNDKSVMIKIKKGKCQ